MSLQTIEMHFAEVKQLSEQLAELARALKAAGEDAPCQRRKTMLDKRMQRCAGRKGGEAGHASDFGGGKNFKNSGGNGGAGKENVSGRNAE